MNAQKIIKLMREINSFDSRLCIGILPENKELLDKIYDLARLIEPCYKCRNGMDRFFWLWTDRGSFEEFADTFKSDFTYTTYEEFCNGKYGVTDYEKMKEQWTVYFPDDVVWFNLYLSEYMGDRGLYLGGRLIIDTCEKQTHKIDIKPLLEWIIDVETRCINMIKDGIYSDFIADNLPYKHRIGVTTLTTYWKYVPEDKERLFGKINSDELAEFRNWDMDEDSGWSNMTSNDYFRICDCLYEILDLKTKYPMKKADFDEPLTPKQFYMRYALKYSENETFLKLDGDSAEAFDKFFEDRWIYYHAWEVCLVPNIILFPEKINGKYYVSFCLGGVCDGEDYALIVHSTLELRKRGMPIIKPVHVEEKMSREELIRIEPYDDMFQRRYQEVISNDGTSDSRRLPMGNCDELIKEIWWYPTDEWAMAAQ